ncbi:MAG: hypothetical protein EOO47_05125 [Flavobacterium sp.]|nr:MAG: hypothetical protein EOO47_05125 [Flavobacterium sp.]
MKNSIKSLFAATLSLVVLTSSAFASTDVKTAKVTELKTVKNINKLVVNGNVEVLLVQAPDENVKVYDSYYSNNALVQQQNGELRISSFQKEKLKVAVYVRNLSSIEASNNATIKTCGKVGFLSLDITLKDGATADINANTINLVTRVKDQSSLKLSGTTTEHYAVLSSSAKLNMENFVADNTSVKTENVVLAKAVPVKKMTLQDLVLLDELAK